MRLIVHLDSPGTTETMRALDEPLRDLEERGFVRSWYYSIDDESEWDIPIS